MSTAVADPSWDCDAQSFTTVEEMRPWYDDVTASYSMGATGSFEAWRDSLLDDSCVPVDCSYTDDEVLEMRIEGSHSCERYACVTGAGAVIAWSKEVWYLDTWPSQTKETDERWSVALPDGTTVEASGYDGYEWNPGANEYTESSGLSVSWTGTPIAGYPADSLFSAGTSNSSNFFGQESYGYRVSSDGCTVSATRSNDEWGMWNRSVSVGDQKAEVWYDAWGCYSGYLGSLDNVLVGAVDETTWARISSDADGDGVTSSSDCDDADASVNPCATDDTVDGIDQDCDGTDGS